jgi:hypothetical protein
MPATSLTLIDQDGAVRTVDAEVGDGGAVRFTSDSLAEVTGWKLEPQGLCRGDVCVPVRGRAVAGADGLVDLAAFAELVGLPLALELEGPDGPVAVLTERSDERTAAITSGMAPDFTLPDLDGNPVSLHDFDRRKRLLLAGASW